MSGQGVFEKANALPLAFFCFHAGVDSKIMGKERTSKNKNESVPLVSIQETNNFCIFACLSNCECNDFGFQNPAVLIPIIDPSHADVIFRVNIADNHLHT